ncbi:TetR/AcrR family transcriptional regulator [Desulforhopalus sp. IMCC35007]|uniref:TetR/AcrR family transcriptional regulator n=1 Tax=Desulforhopalus sp. IMCC35007 TaxID=2569543 RepID=UPI0010AEBA01|nr:TetR/AcrR family transcriptional regulator [Desulforhopalus sp. IMCC35007]TKB09729.1 TetR/AcrR family transcriptional regulator [Desulforhopalus sp. IMCC35007]
MKTVGKHLPADERREVTVATVIELAAEQNPTDITTAAIATRMGLTQGALFRHFPNKAAILQTVMSWVSTQLITRLNKATKGTASPLAALEAMFMAHVDFVIQHPGVPRLLFGELQRAEKTISKDIVQELIKHYSEQLRRLIEEGKAVNELDPDLDPEGAAILFIGTIQGLIMQSLLAGNVGHIRKHAPRVFTIYCRGIRRAQ